ncbi:MAG TPA: hypothetical protein VIV88_18645 [Gemmatimonadales bacterium]|jgi:hypothetical protein
MMAAKTLRLVVAQTRSNPAGTYPIDVRLDGGKVRIACRAGITSRRFARELTAMLRDLWKQPAHQALVRDVAAGRRGLFEVHAAYLTGKLDNVGPTRHEDKEIDVTGWLAGLQASESHKHHLKQILGTLTKGARSPHLSDLPDLLEAYRTRCVAAETPRSFNRAKNAARALLRDTVGRRHALYLAVADVQGMKERKQGLTGLTVDEARAVRSRLEKLDGTYLAAEAARAWWALVTTGCNPKEYFVDGFEVLADRVLIHGKKKAGRDRFIPRVCDVPAPELSQVQFAKLLRRAGAAPYHGRKTFARAMETAGIPRTRREIYRGHGTRDIGDLYERYEVDAFLTDDAAALKRVFGIETLAITPALGIVAKDPWQTRNAEKSVGAGK